MRDSKPPTQSTKQKTLQRLVQAFFNNIMHLLDQLTDPTMIQLALQESAKLVPYVIGSRKVVKTYLQVRFNQNESYGDADVGFYIEMSGTMVKRCRRFRPHIGILINPQTYVLDRRIDCRSRAQG